MSTARHAFEALAAATYDVVLADTRLPDVDGVELVTSLARISPQLPVVGFAADDTDEHVIGVLRAGARGIVLTSALTSTSPPRRRGRGQLPFGEVKNSGYSRELAPLGMDEFVNKQLYYVTEEQSVEAGGPR